MTEEEVEGLELDIERLNFLNGCRTKLDLIRRGYIRDPKGTRRNELQALIERHAHVSWLDPSRQPFLDPVTAAALPRRGRHFAWHHNVVRPLLFTHDSGSALIASP